MQLTTVTNINSLYWITSLRSGEQGISRRVIEDLEPFFQKIGLPFRVLAPQSVAELIRLLQQIASDAATGARPIIHFDTHGDALNGLYITAAGRYLSWDNLCDLLRPINVATENNLIIVSAACFSLNVIRQIAIEKACPFFILLAPEQAVRAGFLETHIVRFYMDVFQNLNILNAHQAHLSPEFTAFHAERMFAVAIARYFKRSCIGAGGQKRREDLISQAIAGGIPKTRRNLRMMRKAAKQGTKPSPEVMNRYAARFLIGRKLSFSFVELIKLVRESDQ